MKKEILTIIAGASVFAACTQIPDETLPQLAEVSNPEVTILSKDDYSVVAKVMPSADTYYIGYALVEGNGLNVDPQLLISNQVEGIEGQSGLECPNGDLVAIPVEAVNLTPNSYYSVVAVACNTDGVLSDVVSQTFLTTDSTCPEPVNCDAYVDGNTMVFYVQFSDPVEVSGKGHAYAHFYAYNQEGSDPVKIIEIPAENIFSDEDPTWMGFVVPEEEAQPGADVFLEFTDGIAVNAVDSLSIGLEDIGYDPFNGIYAQYDYSTFNLECSLQDSLVTDFTAMDIVIEAETELFCKGEGVIRAVYNQLGDRTVTLPLEYEISGTDATKIICHLPEDPQSGTHITIVAENGAFEDFWHNTSVGGVWEDVIFYAFDYEAEDDLYGTYKVESNSLYFDSIVDYLTIQGCDKPDTNVVISGTIGGVEITEPFYGYFDRHLGTLTVFGGQIIGTAYDYYYDEDGYPVDMTQHEFQIMPMVSGGTPNTKDFVLNLRSSHEIVFDIPQMSFFILCEFEKEDGEFYPVGFYDVILDCSFTLEPSTPQPAKLNQPGPRRYLYKKK